jgi:hypothetical protein
MVQSTVVGKMVPIFVNMSQMHNIIHDVFKSSIPISSISIKQQPIVVRRDTIQLTSMIIFMTQ